MVFVLGFVGAARPCQRGKHCEVRLTVVDFNPLFARAAARAVGSIDQSTVKRDEINFREDILQVVWYWERAFSLVL